MAEQATRPLRLDRKNALFAGQEARAENQEAIASLVVTCMLDAVDPLTQPLTAIVNGHKQSRMDELLAWHRVLRQRCPKQAASVPLASPLLRTSPRLGTASAQLGGGSSVGDFMFTVAGNL